MTRAGCAYFGVRIPRHVRADMADLAARGYAGVLHTFSENDLAYYRGTMREIVAASHALGLTVQASPWGLGRTFGGEAESRFVTIHPGAGGTDDALADRIWLLLDQALLLEGVPLKDPASFVQRLNRVLNQSI